MPSLLTRSTPAAPGLVSPPGRPSAPPLPRADTRGITTRTLRPAELTTADVQAWSALEARALEPNLYLSPHFVLPALQHLDPHLRPRLVIAEQPQGPERRLLGVALVHPAAPHRRLPLPHLSAYQSRHSYLGQWLLDRDHAADAATALLRQLQRRHPWAAAVALPDCPVDGEQAAALQEAARRIGSRCVQTHLQQRAILRPAAAGPQALRERMGSKQFSNNERCRRRLKEQGQLDWTILRSKVDDRHLNAFLDLEHSGWKRDSGTSLRSNPADEAFFLAMARGLASEGRALFTELRLDGRAIASTANFVSGDVGFAFKVGWDEPLRKFGIGILNEAEFVQAAPTVCADLRCIDSGSQPASFIEMLWPEQRQLATVYIPLNVLGRASLAASDWLRRSKVR